MKIDVKEVSPSGEIIDLLISFSQQWEAENNVYGYKANEKSDIEGNRIFLANKGEETIGYLFGHGYESKNMTSIMPDMTSCFEVEELYVSKNFRSKGVGKQLFEKTCECVKDEYEFVTLTTATKNHSAILHFYIDEVGMDFWSARFYKKL